ncbi:hypothetical protein P153DRAFT_313762 [Dothidotthia symphoricarpi CBS 119687]|uniref:Peptidase S59 domain-containing protein n=1 Tax=Dothidotthia symphoricarpi CBS 119687 TaxID=1392245 RepID=A0A6A6AFY8_9PLEO|nr:uncharacterized protein P153DRAFT_313762 [Dothidotthia symphoricarpi CBS 119687]KAF2130193.1 hypothetical protein P153DRAFT_313762 [Dothidotthia symphoricarpi CBS 119687]
MSFGGGFGGFGSNNNNQQASSGGFGFGATNNNANNASTGFGSNANSGGMFGSNNNATTGSNMFGGGASTSTSSPFGGGGGFGANNTASSTAFGSKPFGGGTSGGLFGGSGTSGSTFGGFGASQPSNTTSTFGAANNNNNTGGSLFGQNKPAFGAAATTGSAFGGGSTGGGFGTATNTTGGFGSSAGGFGAAAGAQQPNNGTASTPFAAHVEKDGPSGSSTQHFQTIAFQQPYQNYSLEELRVADYNQGRRYGNQNGQAGAFGQSTGFGGFGAANNTNTPAATGFGATANTGTTGGLFGGANNNTSTSAFGQNTGSAFGANNSSSGGLFGQNKPATGGLFGGAAATPAPATGGLFGGGASTTNTTGGFGSGGGFGASAPAAGGLFGGSNTNTTAQAKPFGFGNAAPTNTASTPFGGSTNTGAFGQSNTGGGLFGGNNQASAAPAFGGSTATANTGGGLFGGGASTGAFGQTNQAQNTQQSGGLFGGGGGGGFGQNTQNQQKPGGLFGGASTTTTGGGLFGQSVNQPQQSGGLFGGSAANTNTAGGGGLFGAKPAAAGNSLFGGSTANTGGSTGGLFGGLGGQANQQSSGSSLFGGQNNQQKPGGLFGGSTTNNNTGGSLFGGMGQSTNNNQSNLGGSLFSSQNQQQQNQQPNNNSLFGASGSSLLSTSMNTNPYGNDALFAGLAAPSQNLGPIATPLSSSQKNKKTAILPQHKLNPAASTRLLTPQTKRPGGYGFSYSSYGTPSSASPASGAGFSSSLYGSGNFSRSLGISVSSSNLRNNYNPETSILAPNAFSTTARPTGNGSLKRLNINRQISRTPLFDDASPKHVSFDENVNPTSNGETAVVLRRDDADASPRAINGNEGSKTRSPEGSGTELARVTEGDALTPRSSSSINAQSNEDPIPGAYWSSPTLDQLRKTSKQELKEVRNFVVGRHNIGQIEFNMREPVDLSEVNLDKLYGDIVQLNHRNATVYGETCTTLPKPPLGTALNRPSLITLANSWPRNKAGKKDVKHLERLKRVQGTTFVKYNAQNGDWTFTVPHFSSYGLDYEGEEYSDLDDEESSELSDVPDTPAQTQLNTSQMTSTPQESSVLSPDYSSPDDTFDFKKGMRARASVPGGFSDGVSYEEDEEMEESQGESFLGHRSVGSLDGQQEAEYSESESEFAQDQSMADSVSGPIHTTEQASAKESDPFRGSLKPKSILKASQVTRPGFGTPSKGKPVFDDDWANQLQRTISPKKQDRQALRETQSNGMREHESIDLKLSQSVGRRTLTTPMDLMESLFGETEKHQSPKRAAHGIELPYSKRPKSSYDLDQLSEADKDFHNCSKPHFSESGILIYGNKGPATLEKGAFPTAQEPLIGATKDIRFMQMPVFADAVPETLALQKQRTKVFTTDGAPFATLQADPAPVEFSDMARAVAIDTTAGVHEQHVWQLLSLLFDDADKLPGGVDVEHIEVYRKEKFADWWKEIVWSDAQKHAQQAVSPEERAIAQLSCNNVADACHALIEGLDLRLATMVAQIGGDASMRESMTSQLEEWRRLDMLSEMQDSHRALYELLSGNCMQAEGKTGTGRENRASTFNISSRFALDWRRAFGLRLWYGTMAEESLDSAIAQFADAVKEGKEDVKPVPWFVEASADMGWTDSQAENREDLLWGILKLYTSSKADVSANLEDVLAPENVSGHPLNARLSFQLFQLFKSRQEDASEADERKVSMPTLGGIGEDSFMSTIRASPARDTQMETPLVELGDKITLTYAASLHTPQHWTTAIWVYAHLSSPAMREHYIKALLNQYSSAYSLVGTDSTYTYLTQDLHVPTTWLHAAAALQAKTKNDAVRQATHLIKADELNEAHEVLCRKVGPEAIISRDYDALRDLMHGFVPSPPNSPVSASSSVHSSAVARRAEPVQGWAQGGQIYFDYMALIDLSAQRSTYRVDEDLDAEIDDLLAKLQKALEIAARDRLESCAIEERVALMEIAGVVANRVAETENGNKSHILRLPLTEDLCLRHACHLSTDYYRKVMGRSA